MQVKSAIILAGGKSSRMGEDKGLIMLNGKYMVQHVVDAVKPLVNEIIVVANSDSYNYLPYRIEKDAIESCGPLAGIYTGLSKVNSEYSFVLSCDVPNISTQVLQAMTEGSNEVDAMVLKDGEMTHPLIGIYNTKNADVFAEYIALGVFRLKRVLENFNVQYFETKDWNKDQWVNFNYKEDLRLITK